MKPPIPLQGEALKYWKKHSKALQSAGILSERDVESFALLCKIWGMMQLMDVTPGEENYRTMGQFVNLTKQYQSLAKQFGLLPRERKHSKLDQGDGHEPDEFGI